MKSIRILAICLMSVLLLAIGTTSCNDNEGYSGAISISKVFLEDAESAVPDREVEFARLGQMLRIEGSGFTDLRKIYINGYDTYFNPVLVSDGSLIVRISHDTPTIDATEDVRNTIKMTNDGSSVLYNFDIRAAAPSITSISNTMPNAGEEITIHGIGLTEIYQLTFPGGVEVTEGITLDEDGESFSVIVPEGVSEEGGTILALGANGGAYSPAYFNAKTNVILNFDDKGSQGYWGWSETGSMLNADDLESASLGAGTVSQGNYVAHHPSRLTEAFPAAKNRNTEVWTAGNDVDNWRAQLTPSIPTNTPVSMVAFQFDMYVEGEWSETGYLKLALVNNFNGGEWSGACYNYVPWIQDGKVVPYQSEAWVTVTVPFSKFYAFAGGNFTFEDVLKARETASYKNFGFYFENSDFNLSNITGIESDEATEFVSAPSSTKVYTDNWRIVSLEKPIYSDFNDEEE